jgi:hypothetical protein
MKTSTRISKIQNNNYYVLLLFFTLFISQALEAATYKVQVLSSYTSTTTPCTTSVNLCHVGQVNAVRLYAMDYTVALSPVQMSGTTFSSGGWYWETSPSGLPLSWSTISSTTINPTLIVNAPAANNASVYYRFTNGTDFSDPFIVSTVATSTTVDITGFAGGSATEQICDYTYGPNGYNINPLLELRAIPNSYNTYHWFNLDAFSASNSLSTLSTAYYTTPLPNNDIVPSGTLIIPSSPTTLHGDYSLIVYNATNNCGVLDQINVNPCNEELGVNLGEYDVDHLCNITYTNPIPNVAYFHIEFKDLIDASKTIHITKGPGPWGSFSDNSAQLAMYEIMSPASEFGPLVAGHNYSVHVSAMLKDSNWYHPTNSFVGTFPGYHHITGAPVYNTSLPLTIIEIFGSEDIIHLNNDYPNPYITDVTPTSPNYGDVIEGEFNYCEEISLQGSTSTSGYNLFHNDLPFGTQHPGTTYFYPGDSPDIGIADIYYIAHIGDPDYEGCKARSPWIHGIPNCCENYIDDENYTKWGSLSAVGISTLTENENWSNKILVSGTVTVPAGIRLDITNVDVVFTTCDSKIVVEEGGKLECNNSTFRPCDENRAWGGIEIAKNSIAQFRECVFKNAAVAVKANGSTDISITNNHFVNNQVAIEYANGDFSKDISGNTIINEDNSIEWDICGYDNDNNYIGIKLKKINLYGTITQNNFDAKFSGRDLINKFVGIQASIVESEFNINANNFNNLINAIAIEDINNGTISQNKFTTSFDFESQNGISSSSDYLVRIIKSSNLTVQDNELSSVIKRHIISGFYTVGLNNSIFKGNNIKGLYNGISQIRSSYNNITDNTIDCEGGVGIWLDESDNTHIGCNVIKMNYDYNNANDPLSIDQLGIGIYLGSVVDGLSDANIIKGNCIFDCRMSVAALNRFGNLSNTFKNNFLYNYNEAGLYVDNYFSNVGNGSVSYSEMGRNSFISNREDNVNSSGLFDIYSPTSTIDSYNNYGVTLTNLNVQDYGSDNYHSKASCGLQISNAIGEDFISVDNTEDEYDYCNIQLGRPNKTAIYLSEDGNFKLADNYLNEVKNANDGMTILNAVNTYDKSNINNVISAISSKLNGDEQLIFNIEKSLVLGDLNAAYNYAISAQTNNDYFNVKKIEVDYLKNKKSLHQLTADEKIALNAVVAKTKSPDYPLAQSMLNYANNTNIYKYQSPSNIEITGSDRWLNMNAPHLLIYPNPSSDKISVEVVNAESNTARIEICNITGQPIKSLNTNLSMGVISLDVSELSGGVYFVNLYGTDKTTPLKSKFIKK